eukprot:scaffold447_cov384-Prasinococcus_capsulatus_cf.AAC.2
MSLPHVWDSRPLTATSSRTDLSGRPVLHPRVARTPSGTERALRVHDARSLCHLQTSCSTFLRGTLSTLHQRLLRFHDRHSHRRWRNKPGAFIEHLRARHHRHNTNKLLQRV